MTVTRPAIPATRYAERLQAAQASLAATGAAALLVGVGADLRWLTGYAPAPLERLTLLVLPGDGDPVLLVPRLELALARSAPAVSAGAVRTAPWEESDDPVALVPPLLDRPQPAFIAGAARTTAPRQPTLLVSDRMWATFLLRLQVAFPGFAFGLASSMMRHLRMAKDAEEVALLRAAAHAADRVVAAIAGGRLLGRSEADLAREVRDRLLDQGHDAAAFSIVGSGPNSASPHHGASDRRVQAGEPIVLDIGGTLSGYASDITRTVWVSGGTAPPPDEFRHLYEVVQAAQAAATAAVRPGVPCERIDAVARDAITAAGYGREFTHRTGHGIGLEEHEDPYIVAGNGELLQPGYAFSVEPGIYLEGRYGARVEDIVICGEDGPDVLNEAPRGLLVLDGH